jgi:hypothetical protein
MKNAIIRNLLLFAYLLQFSSCLFADSLQPLQQVRKAGSTLSLFEGTDPGSLPPVIPVQHPACEDRSSIDYAFGPQFLLVLQ